MKTPAELVARLDNHPLNLPPLSDTRRTIACLEFVRPGEASVALLAKTPDAIAKVNAWMKDGFIPVGYRFLYLKLEARPNVFSYSSRMELLNEHKGTNLEMWFQRACQDIVATWTSATQAPVARA